MEVCNEICATGKLTICDPPASNIPWFESVFKVVTDERLAFLFKSELRI
jgi:hypothetical protein